MGTTSSHVDSFIFASLTERNQKELRLVDEGHDSTAQCPTDSKHGGLGTKTRSQGRAQGQRKVKEKRNG